MRYKLCYVLMLLPLLLFLSMRNIPATDSSNDLGRYVEYFFNYCESGFYESYSYLIFFNTLYLACLLDSKFIFVFQTIITIPLSFLPFIKKSRDIFLALAGVLSVASLELMTNALRQGLSFFILSIGLYFLSIKFLPKIFFLLAALSHSSVVFFFPSFFNLWSRFGVLWKFLFFIFLMIFLFIYGGNLQDLYFVYSEIYSEKPSFFYFAFMIVGFLIVPLSLIVGGSDYYGLLKAPIFINGSIIIILCALLFPYITYRFLIYSTLLNYLLIFPRFNIIDRVTGRSILFLLLGTLVHTAVMLILSGNFING